MWYWAKKTKKNIFYIKIINKRYFFHIKINKLKNNIVYLFPLVLLLSSLRMSAAAANQLGPNEQSLAHVVEEILLSRMENVNPVPSNASESESLDQFLNLAQRYAEIIEPSEPFTRRMMAFLDTMHNQRYRAQQREREQRVQVRRIGAKRVFGTDITREVDQNANIANTFA
jgi:hypothetical protein